jgi:isochorismate synthase
MSLTSTTTRSNTEKELLPSLIQNALEDGHAFTLWRMPKASEKHLLICTDGVSQLEEITLEESKTGFVFAPFERSQKKVFFKGNLILTFNHGQLESNDLPENYQDRKKKNPSAAGSERTYPALPFSTKNPTDYRALVEKSILAIQSGALEKVVPSRFREINLTEEFDVLKVFNSLCQTYPDAMISLVSSEETGTWLGASPELIVSIDDQSVFRTVAVAGTKRYEPGTDLKSVAWNEKEIEEQALVSRYIISCFKKIRVREYEEHGPRTSVAGNLLHLKTEYKVDMSAINFPQLGSVMLKLLHPTSAVCGMPLDNAQEFLKANEGYDRQFYSGFLGPVNFKNASHIFVNLRCMQLLNKKAVLYAGAGVTIDSIPEKEWEETEMKFDTLLSIIK